MIELRDVTKVYHSGHRQVHSVRGVSLRIEAGEFVAIMGPSGSGKSTLLHLLGGLEPPTSGTVHFGGLNLGELSDAERSRLRLRHFGLVFQFFNLLPTLTAAENVALPLLLEGRARAEARDRAQAELQRLGLADRADHVPEELSGGEMQRIAIARALVTEPDLVLCDEPTGSLDSASGRQVLQILRQVPQAGRRSVVMVTHDREAAAIGDRLIHIRDGRVESEVRARGHHAVAALDA